jgi:phosphoglycolate phosphatase
MEGLDRVRAPCQQSLADSTGHGQRPGMNRIPFDIVGFDLDGTLVDTHKDLAAALNHALVLAGRTELPPVTTRGLIGGGTAKMLERGLLANGDMVEDARFAELIGELVSYYEDHIAVHSRPFPGGEAMLTNLGERGVKLAIVTNKLERLAVKLIDALGLAERFYTVIGGDTLGPGHAKPAPDLLHEMVVRGGGGRAAYVGDTTFDTRAAHAAGLPCVVASFGYNDFPKQDRHGNVVIDHFDKLAGALGF